MDTQAIELHRPHRQRTLESQQSLHDPSTNTQAQHQPMYRRVIARYRLSNTGLRRNNEVDDALITAAKRHEGGNVFLNHYAKISHRTQLWLYHQLDLFVREPLATATSLSFGARSVGVALLKQSLVPERETFLSSRYRTLANWLDWIHDVSNPEKKDTFVLWQVLPSQNTITAVTWPLIQLVYNGEYWNENRVVSQITGSYAWKNPADQWNASQGFGISSFPRVTLETLRRAGKWFRWCNGAILFSDGRNRLTYLWGSVNLSIEYDVSWYFLFHFLRYNTCNFE